MSGGSNARCLCRAWNAAYFGFADAVAAQRGDLGFRRTLARGDGCVGAVEFGAAHVADVGDQQHVAVDIERRLLRIGLALHQRREHLVRDAERRVELVLARERFADVDDDEPRTADLARDVDRHVVDDAAVDHEPAAIADRRECTGHRHRGADRHREIAVGKNHFFTIADVGRDRAERNRQRVEVRQLRGRQQQPAQQQLQLLSLHESARQRDAAFLESEFDAAEEAQFVFLAPHRQLFARRVVAEHVFPVDALEHGLDRIGVVTRGIEAARDRTHRGSGHAVDRDAFAFEHLQHTDVCRAARTAAAEHEAGLR